MDLEKKGYTLHCEQDTEYRRKVHEDDACYQCSLRLRGKIVRCPYLKEYKDDGADVSECTKIKIERTPTSEIEEKSIWGA